MIIEILYPEICCLYGDKGNTLFLKQCLPNAQFIETHFNETPHFVSHHVDLCYIGSMSEKKQEMVINQLKPYTEVMKDLIDTKKTLFLCTGPSIEIFGDYIKYNNRQIDGLKLFDFYTNNVAPKRYSTLLQVEFENLNLIGYSSRFSFIYPNNSISPLGNVKIGFGHHLESKIEGIHIGSFIGTYLLGPILVSNPDFTLWLFDQLNIKVEKLPFEEQIRQAYDLKCHEFSKPGLELE